MFGKFMSKAIGYLLAHLAYWLKLAFGSLGWSFSEVNAPYWKKVIGMYLQASEVTFDKRHWTFQMYIQEGPFKVIHTFDRYTVVAIWSDLEYAFYKAHPKGFEMYMKAKLKISKLLKLKVEF